MAEKKYYWLRLQRDFFKRHDIRIIEEMENGKDYLLFYLKLLVESIDHEGNLRFSDTVPYNDKMLSVVTNTNVDIVRTALKVFEQLNMVEVLEDETIYMREVEKMIGSETEWAEKKRKQRQLPKLENGSIRLNADIMRLPDGTTRYVDEKRYGGNGMFVLDRAGGKCELCGSPDNVVIHHNNEYSNDPDDLVCLCKKCHGKIHSDKYGGKCPPIVHKLSDKSKSIEIDKEKEIDINTTTPSEWEEDKHTNIENFEYLIETEMKDGMNTDLIQSIKDWLIYKDHRKPKRDNHYQLESIRKLTNRVFKESQAYGIEAVVGIIDTSIMNNYQGVIWDSLSKAKPQTKNRFGFMDD